MYFRYETYRMLTANDCSTKRNILRQIHLSLIRLPWNYMHLAVMRLVVCTDIFVATVRGKYLAREAAFYFRAHVALFWECQKAIVEFMYSLYNVVGMPRDWKLFLWWISLAQPTFQCHSLYLCESSSCDLWRSQQNCNTSCNGESQLLP